MRAPVISRFAATAVATLALGVGLPLLSGGTSAWAVCGATPRPVPPIVLPVHQGSLDVTLGATHSSITVGGPVLEFPVTITNNTDGAYKTVEPTIGLGHFYDTRHDLAIEDVRVSRAVDGGWRTVGLQYGCTRGIVNDYDQLPMLALGKGESVELTFRVSIPAGKAPGIDTMAVAFNAQAEDHKDGGASDTLTVIHPKTASTPAPAATPSATPSDTRAATPQLASTGPSAPVAFLFASSAVLLALGGGLLYAMKRIAQR